MKSKKDHVRILVLSSLFAAICTLATLISFPSGIGYINAGDAAVILSAVFLGPIGAVAAAIGSAIADIIVGYAIYAPATLIIKGLMAVCVSLIVKGMEKAGGRALVTYLTASVCAEAIMLLGYLFYEAVVLSYGVAATASIPSNLIQALFAVILGTALSLAIKKAKLI